MKGVEKLVSAQHGILRYVFGFAAAPEQPPRQIIGGVEVRHHDCVKSAAIILVQQVRWRVRRHVSLFQAPKEITDGSSILFPRGRKFLIRKNGVAGIKRWPGESCKVTRDERNKHH